MFSSYDTLLLLLHLTRNLDTGDVGADTDVGGVSDMSVSSHGDSVSETSGSHNSSVVHVRDNSGGVTVEGLGLSLPLAVDVGMISGISDNTVVDTSVVHVRGNSGDVSVEGLGLSLPLAVDIGMISGISDNTVVDTSMVHGRVNSGSVSVVGLGLSLPLAVDIGMISGVSYHTMVDSGSDDGVSNDSNIVWSSIGKSVSNVMSGSDLSDSVRLRLSLSLPLSVDHGGISDHRVVDSSVREASYSSNTGIGDTSDNTTSSAPSQHLSDGVGIRLAADGYSQEHCEEGTHGEC